MKYCHVIHCDHARQGFSLYCQHHKRALRRHGSPTQLGVTVHELKPFEALIETRKAKNPNSEAWELLTARWGVVQDDAKATLLRYAEGRAGSRIARLAAQHLATIGRDVEPWQVAKTALAMYLLRDQRSSRFESDTAFDFQLVRRVRGLTYLNAGSYWDHKEQRTKRVYQDIPPRVINAMAYSLKAAFGGPGIALAARERDDLRKAQEERTRMAAALEDLE